MSRSSKSLLFLVQRCVAVRQLTLPTAIKRTGSVSSSGFIQQRTWTSTTRTACLQRLRQLHPAMGSSQHRFCSKTDEPYVNDYPPLPAYEPLSEPKTKDMYIVQVNGLPWSCTAQDILLFFSECRIHEGVKGIHLTVNKLGRPTGRAFIEMEHEDDVRKALEKHRHYLGPRYVEVFEVTNHDAEAILEKVVQPPEDDAVVLLRGLPYTCTEDDIIHFFSGLDIIENGITIVTDRRQRMSGKAFVEFSSQKAADEALHRDRQLIGSRYIEVFPSSRDKIHSVWMSQSANRRNVSQDSHKTVSPEHSTMLLHHIHMRGLPFEASGEDIVKFFFPLGVSKILIEYGCKGKSTGEADVYFTSHQDAMDAMSRHKTKMGHRYIELFLNSVPDSSGR